jgi:hypothetical protein
MWNIAPSLLGAGANRKKEAENQEHRTSNTEHRTSNEDPHWFRIIEYSQIDDWLIR